MKILVFSQYYFPERFLIHQITEKLVLNGHSVTVITGLPNYGFPGGEVLEEYKNGRNEETINGVRIYRCKTSGRGTSKFTLLKSYFSYMIKATILSSKIQEEYDIVFCYQLTPITQLYPAINYAKRKKLKLLCYCLDLAPDSGERLLNRFFLAKYVYCKYSKWAYKCCDKIAVTSERFMDYLNTVNGVEMDDMFYLPQHGPEILLNQNYEGYHEETINFLFAGNLGSGANLSTVIYAIKKLVSNKIAGFRMNFVGSGSMKNALEKLTHDEGLDPWIVFHDPVSPEKMPDIYGKADALVLSLRKGQLTVPGKLQSYMATGKPVLGALDGSGKDIIEESNCGKCVAADDVGGLANLFHEYLCNPSAFDEMGRNGLEFFKNNFTLDIFSERLEFFLKETLGNN